MPEEEVTVEPICELRTFRCGDMTIEAHVVLDEEMNPMGVGQIVGHAGVVVGINTPEGPRHQQFPLEFPIEAESIPEAFECFRECAEEAAQEKKKEIEGEMRKQLSRVQVAQPAQVPPTNRSKGGIIVPP